MQLILGTAQLRRSYGAVQRRPDHLDDDGAEALLRHAVEIGVDALDTAPLYADAEEAIGRARLALPVHTKIDPALSPAHSVARSQQRLQRGHIEVLYIHDAAEVLQHDSRVLAEAHGLVGAGVGCLGASVYEADEFHAAVADERIEVVQVPLNLLDRRFSGDALHQAADRGCRVLVRSVLLQGLLANPRHEVPGVSGPLRPQLDELLSIADTSGRTPLELALGWVSRIDGVHGMIVGADSSADLDEIVRIARHEPLDEATGAALNRLPVPDWSLTDPRRWRH